VALRRTRAAAVALAVACVGLAATGCGSRPAAGSLGASSSSASPSTSAPSPASSAPDGGTASAGGPTTPSRSSAGPTTPAPRPAAAGRGRTTPRPTASTTARTAAERGAFGSGALRGRVVVIDPGHNGGNYRHPTEINRPVNVGNGTKACDTTGTETNAGYAEAAFTFDVSRRLAALLRAAGAEVVLTRTTDTGFGPCITERAAIGNRRHADAAISIHADGAGAADHGFHVIVPRGIGANDAIVTPSRRLGLTVRDAFHRGTGQAYSTYLGTRSGAVVARNDLGGLNLSRVPKIFIECGNMRNAGDAGRMTDPAWRQKAAGALATGLTSYLTAG
jgi:N-acetylmuramoyl-L-alanine amidase